ncbi:NADH:flavin oxidoreductase/NADH oxidase family protein [Paenibacillus puldeungensis]|uniref:NADH:flavin oxidoreductase/NADH oxidase family protein n=1 Tax=Paenibacillus puldeungensis TaxID=696536 RepID=UPI0036D3506D
MAKPLTLKNGVTIKNRFFKAALSETLAKKDDGPSRLLVNLYRTWARGGAGLLITGNVMIDRRAKGEPGNVVVEDERDLVLLEEWAKAGTENGTHLWMQLNHPGKQSPKMLSQDPVAPSPIPLSGDIKGFFNPPRALTAEEIEDLILRFGNSARIAKKAGFTGVQIHAAHGYLINQFLSPHHNGRSDEWGGSLENRMRFLVRVYTEIRKQVGEQFPIGIKLNSSDFQRGGFTEEESMQVVKKISELGIDLIEISGGNYEQPKMLVAEARESTKKREAYFLEFAEKVRKITSSPLVVTGGFRSLDGMTKALTDSGIDMVGIGKPFALVPDLPNQASQGKFTSITTNPIKTGVKSIDKSASLLELGWYEQQLLRIGKGNKPKPNYNVWKSLFRILLTQGTAAFKKRRS